MIEGVLRELQEGEERHGCIGGSLVLRTCNVNSIKVGSLPQPKMEMLSKRSLLPLDPNASGSSPAHMVPLKAG